MANQIIRTSSLLVVPVLTCFLCSCVSGNKVDRPQPPVAVTRAQEPPIPLLIEQRQSEAVQTLPISVNTFTLMWDYPASRDNIVFNIYAVVLTAKTNVYEDYDTRGSTNISDWILRGYKTNVYESWSTWTNIATTSNLELRITNNFSSFQLFRVRASNTISQLESRP